MNVGKEDKGGIEEEEGEEEKKEKEEARRMSNSRLFALLPRETNVVPPSTCRSFSIVLLKPPLSPLGTVSF